MIKSELLKALRQYITEYRAFIENSLWNELGLPIAEGNNGNSL